MVKTIYNKLKQMLWVEQWNVAIAQAGPGDFLDRKIDSFDFQWLLKERKKGYYADPFLFVHQGQAYIFLEEYEADKAKGKISCFSLSNKSGKYAAAGPMTVLEKPFHLSYPFVFKEGKNIYMIPETAEANEISLYKAVNFPRGWQKVKTLISNFAGIDPTLVKFGGKYWIFCANKKIGTNNTLAIFYADNLLGPWKPHGKTTVKTGFDASRPAGPLFAHNGELYRPAQNCARTYGREIVINKIVELSPSMFREVEVRRIKPKENSKYSDGLHTLSSCGSYVVIDGKRFVGIKKVFDPIVTGIKNLRGQLVLKKA